MSDDRPQYWIASPRQHVTVWKPVHRTVAANAYIDGTPVRLATAWELSRAGEDHDGAMGPGGRRLCYWCRREIPKGRRGWCCETCVADYKLHHDWKTIRRAVFARDRGVCSLCGSDTKAAQAWWSRVAHTMSYAERVAALRRARWPVAIWRDWWEADHIDARRDGGPDHPDNLRTLCVPCHKARSAAQRTRWASEKRQGEAMKETA